VSGRRAPQLPEPSPIHQLPEQQFLDQLYRLGGIPDPVFRDAEMMAQFLPVLRADISVNESETVLDEEPLACPITALGGLADEGVTVDDLDAWQLQTSSVFERETFPGGHFFFQSRRTTFLNSLSQRLSRITAAL
jgi:medium-chain acyl-[acyl-carrier-protein] hydrolase